MNIIDKIDDEIISPAQIIQFAKDGKYEESWIIDLSQDKPNSEEIDKYIKTGDYKELIVEFIWNPNEDGKRYVITLVQDSKCKEQSRLQFIINSLEIFYQQLRFKQVISQLDQKIVGHQYLLKHPVQRVRLGVFNYWFSIGPIEMWNQGEELVKSEVISKIESRPEVYISKLNYQGLAFIYNFDETLNGPYHVLKTPTCNKVGSEWVVNTELVFKTMDQLINNKQSPDST